MASNCGLGGRYLLSTHGIPVTVKYRGQSEVIRYISDFFYDFEPPCILKRDGHTAQQTTFWPRRGYLVYTGYV